MKSVSPQQIDYYKYVEDALAPEDVHDANRLGDTASTNGMFVVFAIILTIAHGFNLYLFLYSGLWTVIPVIIHCAIALITLLITYAQYRKGLDVQHMAILAIVSSTTGVFGTVGALVGFFSTAIFRSRAQHFSTWYESIFPTDRLSDSQTIYDSIMEGIDENPKTYAVMPFADVMRLGSENQKRRALAKMTSRFSPRFSHAFRIALGDASNGIRVQAATAVAKIERDFGIKLERIEQARTQDPKNPNITMALAKFYDDYAFTGILDPELEKLNRERAIGTYKSYLAQDPNSSEAWVAIGRLMFRNRQWDDAAEWFRHALDRGWRMNTMILWYFECLFRLGQFRELRRAMMEYGRSIVNQEELPTNVREAVNLWMEVA